MPLCRKRFIFIVSISHKKVWTVRGKHRVYCYCLENCYNSNSTCNGNGPQNTSRTYDCLWHYFWDIQTTLYIAPTSLPVISIYLGSFKRHMFGIWLATYSNLKQASSPGYRHSILTTSRPVYKPWCHGETNVYMSVLNIWSLMCTICYSYPIYIYIEVRITSSISRYNPFFETPL
jgi:hypothetical protein